MVQGMGNMYPEVLGIRLIGFCGIREGDITGSREQRR